MSKLVPSASLRSSALFSPQTLKRRIGVEMRYAPLRSRIFLFVFFAGIGTSSLAMSALVTAMPVGARAAF
jgi:hypothetical protein